MAVGRFNTDRDRLRARAHQLVRQAIKAGDIPPPTALSCADCGEPGYCYDHRDYQQPMLIEPVCRACNNRRGPGLPLPTKADNAEYKLEKAAGYKWSGLDGGEGYDPLSAQLHADINLAPTTLDDAIGATWTSRRNLLELHDKTWKARADWFKARDPWCV